MTACQPSSDKLITVRLQADGKHQLVLPDQMNAGLAVRVRASQGFIQRACRRFLQMGKHTLDFHIQLHDEAPKEACFLVDAAAGQNSRNLPLIPDFYCLDSRGYAAIRKNFQELPRWQNRLPIAIWRGSSTGAANLTAKNIHTLKRYRLCKYSLKYPGWLDARFNAIVQTVSSEAEREIRDHVQALDLLRPRMKPGLMALHRWVVDIDGNVNSWGLLWKLLSGSCVLRVNSSRQQWFHNRLKPWGTHVPIEADLSDLTEKLLWSKSHPYECAAIARRGQKMAEDVVADLDRDQDHAVGIYTKLYL
tara:strand:- start:23127 stop:24041 length:915 start_codon:yes stop_codon:yes gene_type:complete